VSAPDHKTEVLNATNALHVEPVAHERALMTTVGLKQPTMRELIAAFKRRGEGGILESAMHLADKDFAVLREIVSGKAVVA
jgi:hypothetical protein